MTDAKLAQRFARLESEIAARKGSFVLFALFLREDVPDRWDLIVSAPWISSDKQGAVGFLIDQIKSQLGAEDLTRLSRIVPVDPEHVAVQDFNRAIQVEHGSVELRDRDIFGLSIKHAYVITSKSPEVPVAKEAAGLP